ncbi:MAG: hypothetical protein H6719_20955 [Sandaracinaceae bacterium]|nr:hypothetical protein [Sandaracinaceae bacterium]
MRRAAALLLVLAVGCAPPSIPDGLTCAGDGGACPPGWRCEVTPPASRGVCVRPGDAGMSPPDAGADAGESCEFCPSDYVCQAAPFRCLHPCAVAPDDCPVDTQCQVGGCQTFGSAECPTPCSAAERCVRGVCIPACEPGPCSEVTACIGGLCKPLLDGAERIENLADATPVGCLAGVNSNFEMHTLERWCYHWASTVSAVPEPRLSSSDDVPLRVVIMGRQGLPDVSDPNQVVALSLFQVYPLATSEDFDRDLDWDFTAIAAGSAWGVNLTLVFYDPTGTPIGYERRWSDASHSTGPMPAPMELIQESTGWSPDERPPPLSLRTVAMMAARGDPEGRFASVAVVFTVWTYGPRVELRHRSLQITATPP